MKRILIFLIFGMLFCRAVLAQESYTASERSLKAAFIFHFISYTEWFDNLPTYNVCIPHDEALKKEAINLFQGKVINNRTVHVTDQADICHVLVSNQTSSSEGTLTIGSLNKGALFEFKLINNKLKFAANLENIKRSKLKISSQLLKLAILDG